MRGRCSAAGWGRRIVFCILIVYVGFLAFQKQKSRVPFSTVQKEVMETADTGSLQQGSGQDFKRFYGLNEKDYAGFSFYYTNQSMGVEEILLVFSEDTEKMEEAQQAAEKRIQTQLQNFEGYGEEQTKLLRDAVVAKKGNFFLMAVSPSADEIKNKFLEIV